MRSALASSGESPRGEAGRELGEVALESGRRDQDQVRRCVLAGVPERVLLPATDEREGALVVGRLFAVNIRGQAPACDVDRFVGVLVQVQRARWGVGGCATFE